MTKKSPSPRFYNRETDARLLDTTGEKGMGRVRAKATCKPPQRSSSRGRRALVAAIVAARFPPAELAFSGGDEAEERLTQQMREDAARERGRLAVLSDDELALEFEFAPHPYSCPSPGVPVRRADLAADIPRPRGRKLDGTVDALRALYGATKPSGVTDKTMHAAVLDHLAAAGRDCVSPETMRRAAKIAWPAGR